MVIITGKVEEISIPEKVDVIISEPIGFLLVHERMLGKYLFDTNVYSTKDLNRKLRNCTRQILEN